MATIKWTESVPSNASRVGNAPVDFRSVWTAIATGLAVEHYWPGVGGGSQTSAGDLRPGGSRTFANDSSSAPPAVSQLTARLSLNITDSINKIKLQRLRVYESAGTYQIGTSFLDEYQDFAGEGLSGFSGAYWLRQAGAVTGVATGSGTTVAAFPITYFSPPSSVIVASSSASWHVAVTSSSTTNFTSAFSSYAGAASTVTIYWEALGVVASDTY
jgi:hypothetical protein